MMSLPYRAVYTSVAIVVSLFALTGVSAADGWFPNSMAESRREAAHRQRLADKASAEATLADAGTLVDLTRLVGVVPDRCQELGPKTKVCSWEVTNNMPGYGVLASILETSKRVYLVCEIPIDNSERTKGSCTVSASK